MPRVHHRKARKDYPNNGIKKGDMYYYTSLKLQRGGIIKRSLTPFKPSQLTTSPFKGGWFGVQEGWEASGKLHEDMQSAAEAMRELGQEEQEKFEAMPEGLQQGDTGVMIEERAQACEEAADAIDTAADEVENLDEPEPFVMEKPDEMAFDDSNEYLEALGEYEDAETDHENTASEYSDGLETAQGAVDDALGEMP